MSDIKLILKEAREAIKNKEYETCKKLCKQILKEKKSNYTALVFLAVSCQELGQHDLTIKSYNEAIKNEPNNPLAWNGLLNFYEKCKPNEAQPELVKIYLTVLKLESNEKKIVEYCEKLSNLGDHGDIKEIVDSISNVINSNRYNNDLLWKSLADLLSKYKDLPNELYNIYEETLNQVINNSKTVCTEYYNAYLTFLYRQKRLSELLTEAKKMYSMFELDTSSLKWICRIYNESFIDKTQNCDISNDEITKYMEKLLKLESKSSNGLLTKSIFLINDNRFSDAKILLKQILELYPNSIQALVLLFKIYIKFDLLFDANNLFEKIEQIIKPEMESLKYELKYNLFECFSRSNCIEYLNRVVDETDDSQEILKCKVRALCSLSKYKEANDCLNKLDGNDEMTKILRAQLLHKQNKFAEALQVLEGDGTLSDWWLEIGLIFWDMSEYDKCLIPFLKAAKLDSNNYKCFLNLGNYYKQIEDLDKARRCYEKSFKINNQCSEAGIELSKIYRQLKNWDANLILLQSLTTGVINKSNCWAWMQLGLDYLEQQQYDQAINYLRFVIRIDSNNMNCWESLADAYLAKGAYTSALKCYKKSSELDENAVYPLLQMANIKQILGEYVEASTDFQEILTRDKTYVPALKGIAETYYSLAKECFRDQRKGTARDYLQLSVDNLTIAIQQRSDLSCIWKLFGDCCYFLTKLPEKFCCLLLPVYFIDNKSTFDINDRKVLLKSDLYTLCGRCYYKAITLNENNLFIWHDLATCYLSQGLNIPECGDEYIKKSMAIAQYCATTSPTNWQFWNLLGNCAFHSCPPNYKLAQHAFIKAIFADNNCAVAWTNLGTLYLILDNLKLANEAFSQAQRSDPNYVNSWIGQAILAETLNHEDAMDLFRHSTQLGMHQQGAIGYGNWVCKTLKESPIDAVLYSIHNMHAIPVACDNLMWYTENNPDDPCAWNMLGILLERMGLKKSSKDAFKNALYLVKEQPYKDYVTINTARLFAQNQEYSLATKLYSQVEAATFNSGSGYALALFKDKNYEKSYEAYEQALHWLAEESCQSDLLVALASMAYMFQGADAAKILLFQSIQLKEPSPWSYYATLALALLHNDHNLAELVFKELQNLKHRRNCIQHFATLTCFYYLILGKSSNAILELSKLIHLYPNEASVWMVLAQLLIRLNNEKTMVAANCARNAMILGQNNMDVTKTLCLVSISLYLTNNYKKSLLMAQKAIHCYPDVAEGWAVLAASLKAIKNKFIEGQTEQILNFIKTLNCSKEIIDWVHKFL